MRDITIEMAPGKYVVAVSGGVDSVVLLDLLQRVPNLELVVAHFDHGIREDSAADRQFVQALAEQYGLSFVYMEGKLGAAASEATAREARYAFLRSAMQKSGAQAIITAHHEDDLLETAILNMLRGTGRKGLSSLKSTEDIVRPLLGVPKQVIRAYAIDHGIEWHEDSTNASTAYLRNYIRLKLLPYFGDQDRRRLRELIDSMHGTNTEIDAMLADYLQLQPSADTVGRHTVIMLPHAVSKELLAAWLRSHGVRSFDKKTIERLTIAAKTYAPGKLVDIDGVHVVTVGKDTLALTSRER
jgi:tRNA(Ile)-lysidine synthetase-like protein